MSSSSNFQRDYSNFGVVQFATDDLFVEWVTTGKCSGFNFALWILENPHQSENIEEAKALVLTFATEKTATLSSYKEEELWRNISSAIEPSEARISKKAPHAMLGYGLAAVMALLLVALFGIEYTLLPKVSTEKQHLAETKNLLEYANESEKPHQITLADGSSVVLQPHSRLSYPENFQANRREVYLVGEGFFEVTKDSKRPFLVYANELVTKVLGTSFTIRAFENERNFTVEVKTGKVSVFAKDRLAKNSKGGTKQDAAILLPNQQAIFSRDELELVKTLVDAPDAKPDEHRYSFEYTDTPIDEVFNTLEKAYAVDIIYDKDVFKNCNLNASMGALPFHEKLRLICKTIKAKYEVIGVHVVVTGQGC